MEKKLLIQEMRSGRSYRLLIECATLLIIGKKLFLASNNIETTLQRIEILKSTFGLKDIQVEHKYSKNNKYTGTTIFLTIKN